MELKTIIKKVKEKSQEIQNNQAYIEKRESELREELKPVREKNNMILKEISNILDKPVRIEIANVVKVLADRWECDEDEIRVQVNKLDAGITLGENRRNALLSRFEGKNLTINFASRSGRRSMTVVAKVDRDLIQKDGRKMEAHLWIRIPKGDSKEIQWVQAEYDYPRELVIEKPLSELCVARWNGEILAVKKSDDVLLKAIALSEKEDVSDVESNK